MRFYRIFAIFVLAAAGLPAASIPVTRPEEAGLSGERLKRVHEAVQRHIEQRNIAGAVTLVSRKGRLAHLEAQGSMNLEAKKPMARDSIFRIFSMTKPVIGVAILMMMEEGKLRLEDPVSRFIPEFKEMKVAVAGPRPLVAVSPAPPVQFNTVAAAREITI